MSLTSSTSSLAPSLTKLTGSKEDPMDDGTDFYQLPSYMTLTRTLARLSGILLPLSSVIDTERKTVAALETITTADSNLDLNPQQHRVLRDLLSPLPHHRANYQHAIEHARSLLLELQQSLQGIPERAVKKEATLDLARKRRTLRSLGALVEEAGREAERTATVGYQGSSGGHVGETVEELLGLPLRDEDRATLTNGDDGHDTLVNGLGDDQKAAEAPPPNIIDKEFDHTKEIETLQSQNLPTPQHQPEKSDLSSFRHRHRRTANQASSIPSPPPYTPPSSNATTATAIETEKFPFTSASTTTTTEEPPPKPVPKPDQATKPGPPPEKQPPSYSTTTTTDTLLTSDRSTQSDLTGTLLSLAVQLKSQSRNLSHHLATTDKQALDRALSGLDANVSNLEVASRKMGFLRRMSEGEGWWGRVMLYLWILGLWVGVLALVFVGPKLRF